MRIIVRPPHIAALLAHGVATVATWEPCPGITGQPCVQGRIACWECRGSGRDGSGWCSDCHGHGTLRCPSCRNRPVSGERVLFAADESDPGMQGAPDDLTFHPGHIVGSGTVEAVVPIIDEAAWSFAMQEANTPVIICDSIRFQSRYLGTDLEVVYFHDPRHASGIPFGGQAQFSTFTPGWTAAIITDAQPTTERCPACWDDPPWFACTCQPIPWTGNDLEEWAP